MDGSTCGAGVPGLDHVALFHRLPTSYLVMHADDDLTIADANETYLASVGRTLEDIVGRPVFEAFPATPETLDEAGVPHIHTSMRRAVDTGRPDTMPVQKYDVPDAVHGGFMERHWSLIHVPVLDDDGRTRWLLQRAEDVTAYVQEREARSVEREKGRFWRRKVEEVEADLFARAQELRVALAAKDVASRRLAGLADAAMSLVAAETVGDLTDIVISTGLARARGRRRRRRGAGRGPAGAGAHHHRLARRRRPARLRPAAARGPAARLRGRPDGRGGAAARPRRRARLLREHAPTSTRSTGKQAWVSVPLRAGTRLLGSLTASWAEERTFAPADVDLLAAFAAQCAQALDRLQVREAEQRAAARARRLSETLQRSLLTEPPEPDHLQIAVRYVPAAAEAQVGGDWYDAFLLQDGTTTLVVGDVTGHDRNAAAAMGQIRNVLRGVAQIVQEPPDAVLSALDRALHNLAVDALATAVLVQVRQDEEQREQGLRELTWSNAGHPPPLLLRPDGTAELLHAPGRPAARPAARDRPHPPRAGPRARAHPAALHRRAGRAPRRGARRGPGAAAAGDRGRRSTCRSRSCSTRC